MAKFYVVFAYWFPETEDLELGEEGNSRLSPFLFDNFSIKFPKGQRRILSLLFLEIHVNWKRTHAVYMYVCDVG